MKYFTYLASSNEPKNALQREAVAVLRAESNLLISDSNAFIATLESQIDKLNTANPRCTPLSISTYSGGQAKSIGISLGRNFTVGFYLYPVKNGGKDDAA